MNPEEIREFAERYAETGNHVRVSGYELWDLGDGVIRSSRGYYDQQEYDRQVSARSDAG